MALRTSREKTSRVFTAVLILFMSSAMAASDYNCEDVEIVDPVSKEVDKTTLCFHKESPTFFISENCANLECELVKKMKDLKFEPSEEDRPGAVMCRALGGGVEEFSLKEKGKFLRCVTGDEHSSVSLNLLESWNGKLFLGPAKPNDLFKVAP